MSHPITGSRRSVLIYSIVWLIVSVLHGFSLWYFLGFKPAIVITEALTSSILFGFLGLLAWYPTRYIPFQKSSPFYSLLAHVVAGLLVLSIWMVLSIGILGAYFGTEGDYAAFLNKSR